MFAMTNGIPYGLIEIRGEVVDAALLEVLHRYNYSIDARGVGYTRIDNHNPMNAQHFDTLGELIHVTINVTIPEMRKR